jgi:hypothetical protein
VLSGIDIMYSRRFRIFDGSTLVEEGFRDVEWDQIRIRRNAELENTDWRAVKDRTMSQAWKDYRQALRDLPQDHASANDAADNWPQPPE